MDNQKEIEADMNAALAEAEKNLAELVKRFEARKVAIKKLTEVRRLDYGYIGDVNHLAADLREILDYCRP